MKKIVVIGNSIAGYHAALSVRESNPEFEIVIFSVDGTLPYNTDLIGQYLSGECTLNNTMFVTEKILSEKNISLIKDKKITRINLNRKKIFTEDKEQIGYDVIILSDTPEYRTPDRRGENKTGVFSFYRFSDLTKIQKNLALVDVVAIETDLLTGLSIANAVHARGKESLVIVSKNDLWARNLSNDARQALGAVLAQQKIQIVWDSEIQEFLGDADLKAIRLNSGKVLAADFGVVTYPAFDLRVLSESELSADKRIFVDGSFQSNLTDVFVVDALAHPKQFDEIIPRVLSADELKKQGQIVAQKILGDGTNNVASIVISQSIKCGDLTFDVCRKEEVSASVEIKEVFNTEPLKLSKIFIEQNRVVSVLLINNSSQLQKYQTLIRDSEDLTSRIDSVLNENTVVIENNAENTLLVSANVDQAQVFNQDVSASSNN